METVFIKVDRFLLPHVQGYIDHVKKACGDICALSSSGGLDEISLLAHRMKGEGSAYGLDEVSAAGKDIMSLAETGDAAGVRERALSLIKYLERVKVI